MATKLRLKISPLEIQKEMLNLRLILSFNCVY